MSGFTRVGAGTPARSVAVDESSHDRDNSHCLRRKPVSNVPSQSQGSQVQLMETSDCPGLMGTGTGDDLCGHVWEQERSSRTCSIPFLSSLATETTSGSGSTSSGKQKQKSASESSSGSGGGGGGGNSSQHQSQRGGRRGGLGSESSDSDDDDGDERKRRPPRDLKKEPKSKVDFPDDDDESTDSADEGADPVIICEPSTSAGARVIGSTSSDVGDDGRMQLRDDGAGNIASAVMIESQEGPRPTPGLTSPINMAVGYGTLGEMPPRVMDKESPESTLPGTPVLDSPQPLHEMESDPQSLTLSPEIVSVSQVRQSASSLSLNACTYTVCLFCFVGLSITVGLHSLNQANYKQLFTGFWV